MLRGSGHMSIQTWCNRSNDRHTNQDTTFPLLGESFEQEEKRIHERWREAPGVLPGAPDA